MYLTGTDGAAYSPKAYDPFGNILDPVTGKRKTKRPIQSISYTKEGNLIQPFAFTGYREEENGLYYAQARSYDPQTGRFISEDKVSGLLTMPDTVNHYIYCFNDPTVYVDNNGLWGKILSNIANAVGEVASTAVNGITSAVDYAVKHPVGTIAAIGAGALVATAVVVAAPVVLGGLATAAVAAGVSSTVVGAVGATATFAVAGAAGAIAGDFVKQDYEINYYHERDEFDVNELKAAGVGGFVSGAAIGFATYGAGMAAIGSASNLYGPLSVSTAIKGMSSAVTLPTVAFSGFMGSSASSGYYQYETTGTINPYQTIGDGLAGGYMSVVTYMGGRIIGNAIRSCTAENSSGIPKEAKNYKNEYASGENYDVVDVTTAEDTNKWFVDNVSPDYKPPYKPGTVVKELELTENTKFVRVYDNEPGGSGMYGGWVMKAEDIAGLTPTEIQDKFALPSTPKYVCDVELDAGTHIRVGEVNPLDGWGNGGGTQYDLMGQRTGTFSNERLIGGK